MASRPRHSAQGTAGAGRGVADTSFDQRPCRLDWTEVVRVRGQRFKYRPALLDKASNRGCAVRLKIIEQDDVAATQPWGESAPHPFDKGRAVHRPPFGVLSPKTPRRLMCPVAIPCCGT